MMAPVSNLLVIRAARDRTERNATKWNGREASEALEEAPDEEEDQEALEEEDD